MNQLRQLMLEELHRRNFAATTIRTYLHGVEHFSRYFIADPISLVRRTGQRPPTGVRAWTRPHLIWVAQLRFTQIAQEATRQDYLHEVEHMRERVARLEQAIMEAVKLASPSFTVDEWRSADSYQTFVNPSTSLLSANTSSVRVPLCQRQVRSVSSVK